MSRFKTYKREAAGACLAYAAALATYAAISSSPSALSVLQLWLPAAFIFAGGAFGLDSYARQIRGEDGRK